MRPRRPARGKKEEENGRERGQVHSHAPNANIVIWLFNANFSIQQSEMHSY